MTEVVVDGSAGMATAQVTVASTPTLIAAKRVGRNRVTVVNHGTTAVFLGGATVSATTGVLLAGIIGAQVEIPTSADVYGITASGTQVVSVVESY